MKNMKIYDLHLNHLVLFLLFFSLFGFHSSHAQAVSQEGQQDVTQHLIEAVQQVRTLAAQQRMEEAIALAESQRELMLAVLSLLMGEDMIRADLANAMAVAALNLGYYEESERQALSMIALPLDKNPEYKALAYLSNFIREWRVRKPRSRLCPAVRFHCCIWPRTAFSCRTGRQGMKPISNSSGSDFSPIGASTLCSVPA